MDPLNLAIPILISWGISSVTSIFIIRRSIAQTEPAIRSALEALRDQLKEEIEPVVKQASKSMSIVSAMGNQTRSRKAATRALNKDILENYEGYLDLLEGVAPNLSEKIRANPSLIIEFLPRIMSLLESSNVSLPDILGDRSSLLPGSGQKKYGKHPFSNEE